MSATARGWGDGTTAVSKVLYKIDITGAVDITNLTGAAAAAAAIGKSAFVDLVALFNANGIASANIPSKIEGLAFGDNVTVNGVLTHTLWVSNDNDFVPASAGAEHVLCAGRDGCGPWRFGVHGADGAGARGRRRCWRGACCRWWGLRGADAVEAGG